MDFLKDYLVIIVMAICLCVGYVIKNIIKSRKIDKFIPLIMAVLGVGINVWINLSFTPEILLGGMVSGLASTGMYNAFNQFKKQDT